MTELERIYDCVFCEGKRKNWNLKTEQYEPCSCIEKVASIEALINKREREARKEGFTLGYNKGLYEGNALENDTQHLLDKLTRLAEQIKKWNPDEALSAKHSSKGDV